MDRTRRASAAVVWLASAALADTTGASLTLTAHQVAIDVLGTVADISVRRTYRFEGGPGRQVTFTFAQTPRLDLQDVSLVVDGEAWVLQPRYPLVDARNRDACLIAPAVLPGSELVLDIRYVETLMRLDGWYELVYPLEFGAGSLATVSTDSPEIAAVAAVLDPAARTVASVLVHGGLPLSEVCCLSHRCEVWREGRSIARLLPALDSLADVQGNLVIRFSLAGDEQIPEVYTYETPDGEALFMVEEK